MKILFSIALSLLVLLWSPLRAQAAYGPNWRPIWSGDVHRIATGDCKVVAAAENLGSWEFFYQCSNGDRFWSDILTPVNNFPFLLSQRPEHDND